MPRFDGTGPMGYGPGTGWGMGPCGAGMAWRKGRGQGREGRGGFRRFWGYMPYHGEITKDEEKAMLEEDAKILEEKLTAVKARLKELKGK